MCRWQLWNLVNCKNASEWRAVGWLWTPSHQSYQWCCFCIIVESSRSVVGPRNEVAGDPARQKRRPAQRGRQDDDEGRQLPGVLQHHDAARSVWRSDRSCSESVNEILAKLHRAVQGAPRAANERTVIWLWRVAKRSSLQPRGLQHLDF